MRGDRRVGQPVRGGPARLAPAWPGRQVACSRRFSTTASRSLPPRRAREGHASGEYVLSGEPPKTISLHVWQADDGGVWFALTRHSELNRLRRIRTEFVGNLSHELRTPLSTVRLLTESLTLESERTELPPRVKESISKIDVETGHLVQMVNELLDLAKIEQGDAPMRHDDVDMVRVVDEAIARLTVYADRQNVSLRTEVEARRRDRGRRRRGPAGPAAGQPHPQRDQVLACGRRGRRARAWRQGERARRGRRTMARAFRARTATASSSASTRSTALVPAAVAARALDLPSRGTSSTATADTSGSRARKASGSSFFVSLPKVAPA